MQISYQYKLFTLTYRINSKNKHNCYLPFDYSLLKGRIIRANVRLPIISHPGEYSLLIETSN